MQLREHEHAPIANDLAPLFRIHADLCRALGNQHRLAILCSLRDGELCVSDLASSLVISVHNVSQHLRVLKEHKVVRSRKQGQTVYYSIANPKFVEACTLIRQAIVEQHQAEGESLLAAALLDEADRRAATSAATP
jgi:DNA-binding transcriptional ArsR family regulator